jgi:hypothetical protein
MSHLPTAHVQIKNGTTHQIIRRLLTVNCLQNNAVVSERIVHFASVNKRVTGDHGNAFKLLSMALLVHVELHTMTTMIAKLKGYP